MSVVAIAAVVAQALRSPPALSRALFGALTHVRARNSQAPCRWRTPTDVRTTRYVPLCNSLRLPGFTPTAVRTTTTATHCVPLGASVQAVSIATVATTTPERWQ